MNVAESLMAQLVNLATTAGSRVYFIQLPQELLDPRVMLPSLTFQQISDTQDFVLLQDGHTGGHRPRYQITAWAPDPSDALALIQQVKNGLIGFLGLMGGGVNCLNLALAGGGDMQDPITRLYKIHADFFILYAV